MFEIPKKFRMEGRDSVSNELAVQVTAEEVGGALDCLFITATAEVAVKLNENKSAAIGSPEREAAASMRILTDGRYVRVWEGLVDGIGSVRLAVDSEAGRSLTILPARRAA